MVMDMVIQMVNGHGHSHGHSYGDVHEFDKNTWGGPQSMGEQWRSGPYLVNLIGLWRQIHDYHDIMIIMIKIPSSGPVHEKALGVVEPFPTFPPDHNNYHKDDHQHHHHCHHCHHHHHYADSPSS